MDWTYFDAFIVGVHSQFFIRIAFCRPLRTARSRTFSSRSRWGGTWLIKCSLKMQDIHIMFWMKGFTLLAYFKGLNLIFQINFSFPSSSFVLVLINIFCSLNFIKDKKCDNILTDLKWFLTYLMYCSSILGRFTK